MHQRHTENQLENGVWFRMMFSAARSRKRVGLGGCNDDESDTGRALGRERDEEREREREANRKRQRQHDDGSLIGCREKRRRRLRPQHALSPLAVCSSNECGKEGIDDGIGR